AVIAASGADHHHGRAKQQRACKDALRSFHISFSPLGCSPPKHGSVKPRADHCSTPPCGSLHAEKRANRALASPTSAPHAMVQCQLGGDSVIVEVRPPYWTTQAFCPTASSLHVDDPPKRPAARHIRRRDMRTWSPARVQVQGTTALDR